MLLPQKRRIALISVDGDPAAEIGQEEAGGQNVYVLHVGQALAQLGWQVDMFTRRSCSNQLNIVQHTPNCRTIRLKAGPEEFLGRDSLFDYLPEFIEEFLKFQLQEDYQYPIVHTNYWLSAWVGMQLKQFQPLIQVHTYHSLGAVKYRTISDIPPIATARLEVEKACLETAERIIATSPQEQEHLRQLVSTRGNVEIIPCGTEIEHFGFVGRHFSRQQLSIPLSAKVVLYVGRFDSRKGIEILVRAIAKSKFLKTNPADLQLIIGGGSRPGNSDGDERARIEGIVNELGLSDCTVFPGRLSREILPIYYSAADVCFVPSHYEPFGLVAIEAMASGTPVVASDVGGLQFTVVPQVTGLLVPPKNDAAFATAIDNILENQVWRDELGEFARKRVASNFSWHSVALKLSKLYSQLNQAPSHSTITAYHRKTRHSEPKVIQLLAK